MEAIALKIHDQAEAWQTMGRVLSCEEGTSTVENAEGRFQALRATSCLVAPEPGDRVLLAGSSGGALYILAVLEREAGADVRLAADGNLSLHLGDGRLTLSASEGVNVLSPDKVAITADRIEANAREGRFFVGSVKLAGRVVDAVVDRVTQRVKQSFRHVEDLDYVRSGQIDYAARGMTRLHGENTLMTARQLVKADAAQIHIG